MSMMTGDPYGGMLQSPQAIWMLQMGYRPLVSQTGIQWIPPSDPEGGLPANLRMAALQETMDKSRGSERNKYMQNTVNPAYAQAMAQQMAMGARGSFKDARLARIMQQGMQEADNYGEEAASRAFSNMVNLREQYFRGQAMGQQQQDRQVSGLGEALQQAKQQRDLNLLGGGGSGGMSGADPGGFSKGRSLMQGLSGLVNVAARNPYVSQGYRQGGVFGAVSQVPRAVGNVLFGL